MVFYEKIDGLRCLAIVAVMVHHIASIFSTYIDWGYFGVDLFFIISGFLITLILIRAKGSFKSSLGRFLARRSLRIFPLYYLVLLILAIIGHPVVIREIGYLLTYTFNYRYPSIQEGNPVGHFWSLGVEEQYYLFWPFIVLGLKKNMKLLIGVTMVIITFAYSQIMFNIIPSISIYNYTGLPARMGSLGLGSLGAMLFFNSSQQLDFLLRNRVIELVWILVWVVSIIFKYQLGIGVGSLFMVLKAANGSFSLGFINSFLSHKLSLYIGRISYGLYVYHVIVIYYFTPYLFDPFWNQINWVGFGQWSVLQYHSWVIKLPLYTAITIAIAELSFRYMELPILKLKDRYFNNI
jgi:peptidoglycan/LPS O-acetylase OafA/YrhL